MTEEEYPSDMKFGGSKSFKAMTAIAGLVLMFGLVAAFQTPATANTSVEQQEISAPVQAVESAQVAEQQTTVQAQPQTTVTVNRKKTLENQCRIIENTVTEAMRYGNKQYGRMDTLGCDEIGYVSKSVVIRENYPTPSGGSGGGGFGGAW